MAKITLEIDNKDKDTVLTILKNLKQGLVKNIQIDNKNLPSGSSIKKVPQKPLEDDFLPKPISSYTRYMSKEDFKARLNKKG